MKQIKRGGGGHVATGLVSVPDGAFALECPACPHPGRNLPQDWDQTPEDTKYVRSLTSCLDSFHNSFFRWLYSYFLALDANFRLKLKSRGIGDPEIGSGWSYFVGNKQYNKHISQNTAEMEVSPLRSPLWPCAYVPKAVGCGSDFHAVSQANTKSSRDYIASGVVACVCARHSLMQKNGVGDLQRGERYVRLDPSQHMQTLIAV